MNEQRTPNQEPLPGGVDRDARAHYARLAEEADRNLDRLAARAPLKDAHLEQVLKRHGISRREFLPHTARSRARRRSASGSPRCPSRRAARGMRRLE